MIELIALVITSVSAVIGATAFIISRLSSQDSVLKTLHSDVVELKGELRGYRGLSERVAILEWRTSKSGQHTLGRMIKKAEEEDKAEDEEG